jgi:hypothetical protein
MRWNSQNYKLKKEIMDYLEGLFRVDTLNKKQSISLASRYLKYIGDVYGIHLQTKPRYEHAMMIIEREWNVLIEDEREKN